MSEDVRYMTVQEVADLLRFGKSTILKMCQGTEFDGAFQARGEWRIPRASVTAYIARQQAQQSPA